MYIKLKEMKLLVITILLLSLSLKIEAQYIRTIDSIPINVLREALITEDKLDDCSEDNEYYIELLTIDSITMRKSNLYISSSVTQISNLEKSISFGNKKYKNDIAEKDEVIVKQKNLKKLFMASSGFFLLLLILL